ncbi:MAG: NAD(P)H-dependent oxidoreductase [Pseudomonadota bacterium]
MTAINSSTSRPAALVLFAHPRAHLSRVNRRLALAARGLEHVEVLDLYETYPDFYIDVAAEQARLAAAEVVVFLHPLLWYSMPSLLKEWVDAVLLPGWAHGEGGHALAGKTWWMVASTLSPAGQYAAEGLHGRPLDEFLHPFSQIAQLCSMRWEPPLVLHDAHQVDAGAVDAHQAAFVARLDALLHHPEPR